MKKFVFINLLLCIITTAFMPQAYAENPAQNYKIEELKPGIFRTQANFHFGVVLEGKDSLLVFDTMNLDYSNWLKKELKKRFNKPVKYVVYSHNHADHTSGGEAFEEYNPVYISHRLTKESFKRIGVATHLPELTFDEALQIDFEGLNVELQYWGANNGLGSISLYVPEKKFISVIDWALTDRVGFHEMTSYNADGIIHSLNAIDNLDWDLISPGHAGIGSKEDVRLFRNYIETIRDGVSKGFQLGQSESEIIKNTKATLDKNPGFKKLKMYDAWSEKNIRGIYKQIGRVEGLMDQ